MTKTHSDYQKTYREGLNKNGLVRYEVQISNETKQTLESLAKSISKEFASTSEPTRMKLAKMRMFDEFANDIKHEFFELRDRIAKQEKMIEALSPTFYIKTGERPIPKSVENLTDDPKELKKIIAELHSERASLKIQREEYQRRSEQYLALYEAVSELI